MVVVVNGEVVLLVVVVVVVVVEVTGVPEVGCDQVVVVVEVVGVPGVDSVEVVVVEVVGLLGCPGKGNEVVVLGPVQLVVVVVEVPPTGEPGKPEGGLV